MPFRILGGFKGTLFVLFRSWDLIVHFLSCINYLLLNPKNSKLYPLKYISRMTIHKLVSKFCQTTALSSHKSWDISTIFQRRSRLQIHLGSVFVILAIFRMIWQYIVQLVNTLFWRFLRYHLTGAELFWRFFSGGAVGADSKSMAFSGKFGGFSSSAPSTCSYLISKDLGRLKRSTRNMRIMVAKKRPTIMPVMGKNKSITGLVLKIALRPGTKMLDQMGRYFSHKLNLLQRGFNLTAVFFETGAMPTLTKSRNPTKCGWGGSFQWYLTHSERFLPLKPF